MYTTMESTYVLRVTIIMRTLKYSKALSSFLIPFLQDKTRRVGSRKPEEVALLRSLAKVKSEPGKRYKRMKIEPGK